MTEITAKLDELADLRAKLELVRLNLEAKRKEVLAQVQEELDALEVEYAPMLDAANATAAELEAEVRQAVIAGGASVKGTHLHAVYAKGRVTWDGKKLDGMMSLIPQLVDARKEGEPSVTIRASK